MPNIARIGDTVVGTCCCHSKPTCRPAQGTITAGAGSVSALGSGIARAGDEVTTNCGHKGVLIGGSSTLLVEGAPAIRVGDSCTGCFKGQVVSGAGTVYNNN
jgi:uncharacterized Zn-binding protein involved in type VI secretion